MAAPTSTLARKKRIFIADLAAWQSVQRDKKALFGWRSWAGPNDSTGQIEAAQLLGECKGR
jgi:hypothetical protein